jgi:hypothetical protein
LDTDTTELHQTTETPETTDWNKNLLTVQKPLTSEMKRKLLKVRKFLGLNSFLNEEIFE